MQLFRRFVLIVAVTMLLAPVMRAATSDAPLVITLEHHWVVELGGHRFGLIEFDSPMTTVLLGGYDFDLPMPAFGVLAPLFAVPALAAVGIVMHGRRRRYGF